MELASQSQMIKRVVDGGSTQIDLAADLFQLSTLTYHRLKISHF